VQLSTRGRYAVMAMVHLASCEAAGSRPVTLAEIATRQILSQSYLEQLFGRLRRAGLVCSARGPGGGYRLARPAEQVSIADILLAVEEPIRATRCEPGTSGCMVEPDGSARKCQTHDLWAELGRQIHLFLAGVTLADVVHDQVIGRAMAVARLPATPEAA
jgi:Rrf2 family iron-sulfur cluster assembly transcriptional regulator